MVMTIEVIEFVIRSIPLVILYFMCSNKDRIIKGITTNLDYKTIILFEHSERIGILEEQVHMLISRLNKDQGHEEK